MDYFSIKRFNSMMDNANRWLDGIVDEFDGHIKKIAEKEDIEQTVDQMFDQARTSVRYICSSFTKNEELKDGIFYRYIDMPGADKDSLSVDTSNNYCTVKWIKVIGDRKQEMSEYFNFPEGLDLSTISAKLSNGVLTISTKLLEEKKQSIKVEVEE